MLPNLTNGCIGLARRYPSLFFPLIRLRMQLPPYPGFFLLTRETDLVIEGFFRTANTFARLAFAFAQPGPVSVASHTHALATVLQAVRWRKPVLVLIREPADAVASRSFLHPHVSMTQSLRDYIAFYQGLQSIQESIVLATFEEVVTDFGAVTLRVNAFFQTQFAPFKPLMRDVQRIRAQEKSSNPAITQDPAYPQLRERVKECVRMHRLHRQAQDTYHRTLSR